MKREDISDEVIKEFIYRIIFYARDANPNILASIGLLKFDFLYELLTIFNNSATRFSKHRRLVNMIYAIGEAKTIDANIKYHFSEEVMFDSQEVFEKITTYYHLLKLVMLESRIKSQFRHIKIDVDTYRFYYNYKLIGRPLAPTELVMNNDYFISTMADEIQMRDFLHKEKDLIFKTLALWACFLTDIANFDKELLKQTITLQKSDFILKVQEDLSIVISRQEDSYSITIPYENDYFKLIRFAYKSLKVPEMCLFIKYLYTIKYNCPVDPLYTFNYSEI